MENSSPEDNDDQYRKQKRRFLILFIFKSGIAICLLTLGGSAVRYTRGQTDTFGPPYFLGAFIVGSAFVLGALIDILIYLYIYLKADTSAALKDLYQYIRGEICFTLLSVMGGLIGIMFVAISGVPKCDPDDFFSHCNYTQNISQNHTIAVLILLFLILSVIVAIGSVVVNNRPYFGLSSNNAFGQRIHSGISFRFQANNTDSIVYSIASELPSNYSEQSQAQNHTLVHPPEGDPQSSGQGDQNDQGGREAQSYGQPALNTVNDLPEQNRLQREQIALQQEQLMQQQQQLDERASSPDFQPPPSYDSCMQGPSQLNLLREKNKELQNIDQSQQERLEKLAVPSNLNIEPSAPPL